MAHATEEVEEMTGVAQALVLNIGTLTKELVESMLKAARKANDKGIPVVLDAVGVGATNLRTASARRLLDSARIDVLKGNAGEIATLLGVQAEVRGVESISTVGETEEICQRLASSLNAVVVVSGVRDIVSDGDVTYVGSNGTELMGRVVGTGCMQSSVIGCFCAVEANYLAAVANAVSYFGVCGQIASERARGAGTFRPLFFDALETVDYETLKVLTRLERRK